CQPTQVAGTSLTQMETVSAGASIACVRDELAQDRRRTWFGSKYGPEVLPTASRAATAHSATAACQGERNAAQLYREISERGYRGAATMVRAYIGHLRTTTADGSPPLSRKERSKALSPRALRWLLS